VNGRCGLTADRPESSCRSVPCSRLRKSSPRAQSPEGRSCGVNNHQRRHAHWAPMDGCRSLRRLTIISTQRTRHALPSSPGSDSSVSPCVLSRNSIPVGGASKSSGCWPQVATGSGHLGGLAPVSGTRRVQTRTGRPRARQSCPQGRVMTDIARQGRERGKERGLR
jgi:hypothetical protein